MSLGCAYANGLCNQLNERTLLNRLNERDISLGVSSAAVFLSGIDLNSVVLDRHGYVMNSSSIIRDVLDVGLRRLYLDVFWDPQNKAWNLCPYPPPPPGTANGTNGTSNGTAISTNGTSNGTSNGTNGTSNSTNGTSNGTSNSTVSTSNETRAFAHRRAQSSSSRSQGPACDYEFNFDTFISTLTDYINLSDTNIAASLIYLHLRPRVWSSVGTSAVEVNGSTQFGVRSLNETLTNAIGDRVMTPGHVRQQELKSKLTREGVAVDTPRGHLWPDLRTTLIVDKNRLVVTYNDSLASTVSELENLRAIAFAAVSTIENPAAYSIDELSGLNFTDTFVSDFAGWREARRLGVSPVLAAPGFDFYSTEMWQILNYYEFWSWMPGDPELYSIKQRQDMLTNGHVRTARLEACAVLTLEGFEVANCNAHYPVLCKNKTDSFDWVQSEDVHTYFDPDCPSGYSFGVPTTPLEARYIRENVFGPDNNVSWVDFNSLFLPNCWVTGGTNVVCPYNIHDYSRNGIGLIAVASVVAFVGFVSIWLFEWDRRRSPLMRKSYKRQPKEQFEGIPS